MSGARCGCENLHCGVCFSEGCSNPPSSTVQCEYIIDICDACAEFMPDCYLHSATPSPGPFGCKENGPEFLEGPHFPAAHTWYAKVTVTNGVVTKVF